MLHNRNRKNMRYIAFIMFPVASVFIAFVLMFVLKNAFSLKKSDNADNYYGNISDYISSLSGTVSSSREGTQSDKEASDSNSSGDNDKMSGTAKKTDSETKYIFVGDSRYVGMRTYAQSNDIFISEVGVGYRFLSENYDKILEYADKNSILVVGLGVNDYAMSCKNYIATMNELADTLECKVYYMLINPVEEEKELQYGYSATNEMIDKYNALLVEGFNSKVGVIDTNTYLKEDGFSTLDGLHYDDVTYKKIYNYLKSHAL